MFRCQTQRRESESAGNTNQIETFYTLILQTPMDEKQPQLEYSDRCRWTPTEQKIIRVRIKFVQHTQCSNMTSMTQRQETVIRVKPGLQIHLVLEKLKMTFSGRPPHRRTILKYWENKCIIIIIIIIIKKRLAVQGWEIMINTLPDWRLQPHNTNALNEKRKREKSRIQKGSQQQGQ